MKEPITINKNASVYESIRKLLDEKISRLLVEEDGVITGIVTQKDVGIFLLKDTTERRLEQIPISKIVRQLQSIQKSATIRECAQLMMEHGYGSIGVSDGGKIIGIITKTDLAKFFHDNYRDRKVVGEYMSPYYAWVYWDTQLYKVVTKMFDEKISRVVLRDHDERPVGILSFRDLFRTALIEGQEKDLIDNTDAIISVISPRKGFLSETGFGGTTVAKDLMKDEIITVNYDDDLADACKILNENRIHGVGVLSGGGAMIGILSKTDVIKALAFIKS